MVAKKPADIDGLKAIISQKNSQIYFLKQIIDNIPGDIYWKNKNGVYSGMNTRGRESLRAMGFPWRLKDILGKTDYDLFSKKIADIYRKHDLEVMEIGHELTKEEANILPSGEKKVQLSTKRMLRDQQGNITGIVGNTVDITYLKKIENDLRMAIKDAEKANEEKFRVEDEFKKTKYQLAGAKLISGSIAHEIRTPLAAIKSASHGLKRAFAKLAEVYRIAKSHDLATNIIKDRDLEQLQDMLHIIDKKVDQSNVIINMLLTKLQNTDFDFSDFNICPALECIENAIVQFSIPKDIAHKIKIIKNQDFKFLGNKVLITHIIMNLLKNAIYFVYKANKGEITIWLEQQETHNEIHFKDTAYGISHTILPHIFDSFFTTEASTGTGIGLAFSKMVMQSHKGQIQCISQEGEYTEFILSFPKLPVS